MGKLTTKISVNYSINKKIIEKFNEIAEKKAINKSALIELFIKDWINTQKI